jgi:TusA-related sulfurtransferase
VVCALCQNILVMLDDPIFIEDIAEAINKEEYEFDHFKFNLKVPQGIAIRERQMALFLQKRHP